MVEHLVTPGPPSAAPKYRGLKAVTITALIVALLAGALTIPFFFESPSMYYKFGWKKSLLRAGKMVGLGAAFCLLMQLPLAGRMKWLDRLFSLPVLYTVHRYSAHVILFLVIVHPIAVFAPDGILMIPFEGRYWPEWVGAGLLLAIIAQFTTSYWRSRVITAYQRWLLLHRVTGGITMAMLIVHVLYVSETFEHDGLPRNLVLATAAGTLVFWSWIRFKGLNICKKAMTVKRIEPAGTNAYRIAMQPSDNLPLAYAPGQFSFASFQGKQVSKEPHPFTLSSTPSAPETIEMIIRCTGDWTKRTDRIQPGDKAYLQGPFGRFSHLLTAQQDDLVMIAGGIGITPMLSMLRYMGDVHDTRQVTLIWSNQTPAHLFNEEEFEALANKLTGFRWVPIFTREKGNGQYFGRLNRRMLESLIGPYENGTSGFVCGPQPMIRQVRLDLKEIGFPKGSIHFEAFGF